MDTATAPRALFESSGVKALLDQLDAELIGLAPVKGRIRDIAALLLIDKLRAEQDLQSQPPTLHMSFTGNPGTGKTTVARLLAAIYRSLGVVEKGQLVETDRSGLVSGFVGQTALKVMEVADRATGGVLLPSIRRSGSHSSHFGRYQFQSPSKRITAGTRIVRTMVASSKIATASPNPTCCRNTSRPVLNPRKTTTMISAAPVMMLTLPSRR